MKTSRQESVLPWGRLNRIDIKRVALLVLSMAAWGAVSAPILAQPGTKVPIVVGQFDTSTFGPSNNFPQGIAYNSIDAVYAIVDSTDDMVYIVDSNGVRQPGSDFDTTIFGSDLPTGIGFNPVTGEYAITDSTDDQVYIVDGSGTLQGSFDTSGFSSLPTGIGYEPGTGNWAITDSTADMVYVVDGIGQVQTSFDTTLCGSNNPTGITWKNGEYHIIDATQRQVFITNLIGGCQSSYDTANFDGAGARGISYNDDDDLSAIVDNNTDEVYPIDDRGELTSQFDIGVGSPSGIQNPSAITATLGVDNVAILDDVANQL